MNFFTISEAWAAYTVPDHISIDMGTLGSLTLMVLGACATVWVLRKLIKTINRS